MPPPSVYWPRQRGDLRGRDTVTTQPAPREGPEMPFYFFCLLLGMLIGALFTWFLLAEHPFESREAPGGPVDQLEAGMLADQMKASGTDLDEETVVKLLQLHGAYVVGREETAAEPSGRERVEAQPADDQAQQPSA
jgi:hypothetical protein